MKVLWSDTWDFPAQARGGRKEEREGRQKGGERDLEIKCAKVSSPAMRGASSHPHFTLDSHLDKLMAVSPIYRGGSEAE